MAKSNQKSDSVESILNFLQEGNSFPKTPLRRKEEEDEDEDENIFAGLDDGSSTPPTPPNMITGDY